MAMSTPEKDYLDTVGEGQQEKLRAILLTWRGLGVVGCRDCQVPSCTAPALDGDHDEFGTGVSLGRLTHYAIELNALKRPEDRGIKENSQQLNEFDERTLFDIAMRIGLPEESFGALSNAFQSCIACPNAITCVGETPSFEEAVAILEAEQ